MTDVTMADVTMSDVTALTPPSDESRRGPLLVNALLVGAPGSDLPFQRVLYIDPVAALVALIDVEPKDALPRWQTLEQVQADLENGMLCPVVGTIPPCATAPTARTEAAKGVRDTRWAMIREIVLDPSRPDLDDTRRAAAIAAVIAEAKPRAKAGANATAKVTKSSVYQYLRLFWQRGQTREALTPGYAKCGAPTMQRAPNGKKRGPKPIIVLVESDKAGVAVNERMKEDLQRGYKRFYLGPERQVKATGETSLSEAYRATLKEYFRVGMEWDEQNKTWIPVLPPAHELPTREQFVYWGRQLEREMGAERAHRRRVGSRSYDLRNRPLTGTARSIASAPGAVYQVDATVGDIYLLSSLRRGRLIGRPVIYVVIDVYSGLIVGFHVCLEGPSWEGLRIAIEHALCDKVAFCRRFGIEITAADWPSGKCQMIMGDRGELLSQNADWLADVLQIGVANTASWRGDYKGPIERHFGLINHDALKHLPGWVPGAVHRRERGAPDCRLDAKLTLDDLVQLLTRLFLHHNLHRRLNPNGIDPEALYDEVEPYPIDLWNWGIAHRAGSLRTATRDEVRAALLPRFTATPSERGLRVNKLLYSLPEGLRLGRGSGRKAMPLDGASDPRDVSTVLLWPESGEGPVVCPLDSHFARFAGRTLEEVKDEQAVMLQGKQRRRDHDMRAAIVFDTHIDTLSGSTPAGGPARPTREGQRAARADERTARRKAGVAPDAADTTMAPLSTTSSAPVRGAALHQTDVPAGYVPQPDELALLRAARDKDHHA